MPELSQRLERLIANSEPKLRGIMEASAAEHPQERKGWSRIGGGDPLTLEFLIGDYVDHMRHHLDHILQ